MEPISTATVLAAVAAVHMVAQAINSAAPDVKEAAAHAGDAAGQAHNAYDDRRARRTKAERPPRERKAWARKYFVVEDVVPAGFVVNARGIVEAA